MTRYQKRKEFYDNYDGDKVGFTTFYSRMLSKHRVSLEDAINPEFKKINNNYPEGYYEYYHSYEGEKCIYETYIARVRRGKPFHIAVLPVMPKDEKYVFNMMKKYEKMRHNNGIGVATVQPKHAQVLAMNSNKQKEEYYGIDIKYNKAIALIFKKAYERQLTIEENNIIEGETNKELNEKIERIEKEYKEFCVLNNV